MLDHVKLFVSDVDRSRAFYALAFQPLGYSVLLEPAPGVVGMGRDFPTFWLAKAEEAPTTAHVAIRADSRSVVDEFHSAALAAGGIDNGAPGPRPQYHPGYYGAFVHDPDGNNVEAVCHEPPG
jgi:catechol 2,3-dioxygenase-like lactoylglutathione lyase family enzyme